MLSKTRARPLYWVRCGEATAGLMMAPTGARLQHGDTAFGQQRLASKPDHLGVRWERRLSNRRVDAQ